MRRPECVNSAKIQTLGYSDTLKKLFHKHNASPLTTNCTVTTVFAKSYSKNYCSKGNHNLKTLPGTCFQNWDVLTYKYSEKGPITRNCL